MKKLFNLAAAILLITALAGCFGEDYDVGVPTAFLQVEVGMQSQRTQLAEAAVDWSSSSGDVKKEIEEDHLEEYGLSQEKTITVFTNQKGFLDFEENEENGGDIWTDPTITAALWNNGEQIDLELNDSREFQFPDMEGNFVLEVNFIDSTNEAQYAGNILIKERPEQTFDESGDLPDFTIMEMPSIQKGDTGLNGMNIDFSYTEVCWNNCENNNLYNHPEMHSADVEIGDKISIDWHTMNPKPDEINLLQINTENYEVIKTKRLDRENTPFDMEVDEETIDQQFAVEFLWKKGNELKGRSMLDFRLE
ncbi:hypothetical protein [Bacillus salacetis]|uniref:hypothetical protein n=1 Tax=Bacillus salacetis TaxID=2315464 RepID=UPI00196A8B61|nr:hypothetical protein [Bacillus salacetis]